MTERIIAPYEKFVLTTSRKPSQRTRSFVRDLVRVIPWSFHFTRGSCSLNVLADELSSLGINRLMVVHEKKGNPSLLKFYKLVDDDLEARDYRVRIKGISLGRELKRGRSVFTKESKFSVVNYCQSDFGEQLYTMLSIFFNFERIRELPQNPNFKGIAIFMSDKDDQITIDFQQIETKEMIGPRITISDVYLGKKGEVIRSLMSVIGLGKRREQKGKDQPKE
ncbi:MAG: Brix domain-containing protein [Candidatus Heimdallarchaeota archaeon]